MKENLKKYAVIAAILLLIASISTVVSATGITDPSGIAVSPGTSVGGYTEINNVVNNIYGIVAMVAYGVAVIMLIFLAIKYISAAPSEKADIKKGAVIYIVGAAILFGAGTILTIIQSFATSMTN